MRRTIVTAAATASLMLAGFAPAATASCTEVSTSKGVKDAAQVGGDVTGSLNATGCDIGVYYSAASASGDVEEAEIFGASDFGVFVDGKVAGNVEVDVADSWIHDIGDSPFSGRQSGIGVYYYGYQTAGSVAGTVSDNHVSQYQKGGIVVNGGKAEADVTGNGVIGLGRVGFIAQNGIQFGFDATVGAISGNVVRRNIYTQTDGSPGYVSSGMLFYLAANTPRAGRIARSNRLFQNQANLLIVR